MIFIGTLFCNLLEDAMGLHLQPRLDMTLHFRLSDFAARYQNKTRRQSFVPRVLAIEAHQKVAESKSTAEYCKLRLRGVCCVSEIKKISGDPCPRTSIINFEDQVNEPQVNFLFLYIF
jgi:hypothetical protein